MTELEERIWNLVHNWCDEQSCEIPDFNRRALMERILALRQPNVSGQLLCYLCRKNEVDTEDDICENCRKD